MPRSTVKAQRRQILSDLLRRVRQEAGLRQADIATRMKKPQSFVSNYESGERRLDLLELQAVCEALSIPLIQFVKRYVALLPEK